MYPLLPCFAYSAIRSSMELNGAPSSIITKRLVNADPLAPSLKDKIQTITRVGNLMLQSEQVTDSVLHNTAQALATHQVEQKVENVDFEGHPSASGQIEIIRQKGEWKEIKDAVGNLYQGTLVDGNGAGTIQFANGDYYKGEIRNGVAHGQGRMWFREDNYSLVVKDPSHGKDRVTKYSTYVGEFTDGRIEGKGCFHDSNGDVYMGNFKNWFAHGRGTRRYANGDVYTGDFFDDLPHGYGKYKYNDGSIHRGFFVKGDPRGPGIYSDRYGNGFSGNFTHHIKS